MYLSEKTKQTQNLFFLRYFGISYQEFMQLDALDQQRLVQRTKNKEEAIPIKQIKRMDGTPVNNKIKKKV